MMDFFKRNLTDFCMPCWARDSMSFCEIETVSMYFRQFWTDVISALPTVVDDR